MTAPDPLTPEQLAELKVLVSADAWSFHAGLRDDKRVDVDAAYRVRGNLTLVAVDVLRAASRAASRKAAEGSTGQTKRLKDGGEEIEFFQGETSYAADAKAWADLAAELLAGQTGQGTAQASANPAPILEPWGIA